jgi:transcriptional regulator GlxA family with amidase domain
MNTKLSHIQNWPELAEKANWFVAELAKRCGVSVRVLERHFLQNMGRPPKAWLIGERQHRALKLLHDGWPVKVTAAQLGYKYAHHFSREFKAYWGFCPSSQMTASKPTAGECRVLV